MKKRTRGKCRKILNKEAEERRIKAGHLKMMLDDSPNDPRIDT